MNYRIAISLKQMLKFYNASSQLLCFFMSDIFVLPKRLYNFLHFTILFLISLFLSLMQLILLSTPLIMVSKNGYRHTFNGLFSGTSKRSITFPGTLLHFSTGLPIPLTSSSFFISTARSRTYVSFLSSASPLSTSSSHCLKQTHPSYNIVIHYRVV